MCIGYYLDYAVGSKCIGFGYSTFGNHVGDWEHITIRFVDGYITKAYLAAHSGGKELRWGYKYLRFIEGSHLKAYAAKGSHGSYYNYGNHKYEELENGDSLVDECNAGY